MRLVCWWKGHDYDKNIVEHYSAGFWSHKCRRCGHKEGHILDSSEHLKISDFYSRMWAKKFSKHLIYDSMKYNGGYPIKFRRYKG